MKVHSPLCGRLITSSIKLEVMSEPSFISYIYNLKQFKKKASYLKKKKKSHG